MTENPYKAPEAETASSAPTATTRKQLVPIWIKVFGWFFMVVAALMAPYMIWSIIAGTDIEMELFGVSYAGPAANPYAFIVFALFAFLGFTAYGLLFGKDWGVTGCLVNGYLGLGICILTMILSGGTNIRAEPIVHFFYLRRLHKIRKPWITM